MHKWTIHCENQNFPEGLSRVCLGEGKRKEDDEMRMVMNDSTLKMEMELFLFPGFGSFVFFYSQQESMESAVKIRR